jgi:hypothetical protein
MQYVLYCTAVSPMYTVQPISQVLPAPLSTIHAVCAVVYRCLSYVLFSLYGGTACSPQYDRCTMYCTGLLSILCNVQPVPQVLPALLSLIHTVCTALYRCLSSVYCIDCTAGTACSPQYDACGMYFTLSLSLLCTVQPASQVRPVLLSMIHAICTVLNGCLSYLLYSGYFRYCLLSSV